MLPVTPTLNLVQPTVETQTAFVSAWDLCSRYVSLCALMACRLFLSSILAAACTLVLRKLSGNQRMLAVSVTAGTWDRKGSKQTRED